MDLTLDLSMISKSDNILEVRNLVVDYGIIRAIKGVNINVPRGKVVSILGANGAGKTSTLRTIHGLVKPTSGRIIFNDRDITGKEPFRVSALGLSQSPEGRLILEQLTTEENLRVGAYTVKNKAQIKRSFEEVYELFPILYERRKQQATTLSGGEQQMLAIGRAMMSSPKLLMLDEPSLGLAPLIVKAIFESITRISKEGVTVLMVEQNAMQSLMISDYAYVMELGLIKMQGIGVELLKDEALVSAYLGTKKE